MTAPLFHHTDLRSVLMVKEKALSDEINTFAESRVLNTPLEGLCDYFVERHKVEPIVIDVSGIQVDYGDAQIDVSNRFEYVVYDRSTPTFVNGTKVTFFVPFTGDPGLFKCRPSRFNTNPPQGVVRGNELVLSYVLTTQDTPGIKDEFERDIGTVKKYVSWISSDVEQFNSVVHTTTRQQIEARREKLLRDRGIVENLGLPLRRRAGVPATYTSPEVKRRIVPQLPPVSTEPHRPEPALVMAEYEHILSVISNMVMVIERSPKAFRNMGEEDFRQHFLVQLNGQYEGQATGETFNYEGKTDILIREKDRNIFIAECKFWTGSSGLHDALNQLLGYTRWRDTKTALLIFNRGTAMSTVLEKVPKVIEKHPNYKARHEFNSETGFRYVFRHRDDSERELALTVLVFDVPA